MNFVMLMKKINTGDILIHPSYSILFCKTKGLMNDANTDGDLGCYATVYKKTFVC
jgi:hypothetical protein